MEAAWLTILFLWAVIGVMPAAGQDQSKTSAQTPAQTSAQTSAQTRIRTSSPTSPHAPFRIPYKRDAESLSPPGTTSNPAPAASSARPAATHPDPPPGAPASGAEILKPPPAPELPPPGAANGAASNTVSNECSGLLNMATSLKAEVDKTTKDELSVAVVREAGQIEVMAHKMREGTEQH
ncbi:MAG: hypothetical protein ACRD3N_17780 [Terracidiphilus sp.]